MPDTTSSAATPDRTPTPSASPAPAPQAPSRPTGAGFLRLPNPPEFWPAVHRGVEAALATLPAGAATVTWDEQQGSVEVVPRTPDAATVAVWLAGNDEVIVQTGRTHFYSFGDADAIARDLEQLLTAVFAGRIESASIGNAARITTDSAGVVKVGDRQTFPLPWGWRRPVRYAAYA